MEKGSMTPKRLVQHQLELLGEMADSLAIQIRDYGMARPQTLEIASNLKGIAEMIRGAVKAAQY